MRFRSMAPRLGWARLMLKERKDMATYIERQDAVVVVGSTVKIRYDDGQAESWQIVSTDEGDLTQSRMTEGTPLATAVLGHGMGERVRVDGPGGRRWWVTIEAVSA